MSCMPVSQVSAFMVDGVAQIRSRETDREARQLDLRGQGRVTRVLIADEDWNFRAALRRLLETYKDQVMVWEAKDGEEAIHIASIFSPDVMLVDFALLGIDGLELSRLIKVFSPETRVIVCSDYDDRDLEQVAILQGADGFLFKSSQRLCEGLLDQVEENNRVSNCVKESPASRAADRVQGRQRSRRLTGVRSGSR